MGDNSVEQLEQRVAELEATVRGLTDELVDTTERLRQLETTERQTSNAGTASSTRSSSGSSSGTETGTNGSPPQPDATSDHPVENSADDDGALVDADGRVEGETQDGDATTEESAETGETDDSDDIIVA